METKVITLRYNDELGGFPEDQVQGVRREDLSQTAFGNGVYRADAPGLSEVTEPEVPAYAEGTCPCRVSIGSEA